MQKEHSIVYREAGKFAGWPANYGMWAWGDELIVGFTQCIQQATSAGLHSRSKEFPAIPMQARSLDGGHTWQSMPIPASSPGNRGFSADEHMIPELRVAKAVELGLEPLPQPCPGNIDFTHPDFAMMVARTGLGAGTQAWFYLTMDRAHTWQGPFTLPMFGQSGVEARTDVVVNGPSDCMIFLSAAREDGDEGKGVFLAQTTDGGRNFELLSWVANAENDHADDYHMIMPSSVRIDAQTLLCSVRCWSRKGEFTNTKTWIDLYRSTDNGRSFQYFSQPVPDCGKSSNPPALTKLHDGRLCITYGYRSAPFGIRAQISEDGGKTWGEAIHLRDDGACADLGYPRTIQRPDGTLVTTYYFNDQVDSERYIAATLWTV